MNLRKEERILLLIAVIIIGVLVGYNAFYIPEPSQEVVVYTDVGDMSSEEYEANSEVSSIVADKININTATLEELETLSGIGATKAQSIIDYREANGGFSSTDELMNVSGIGESTYDNIKNNITV